MKATTFKIAPTGFHERLRKVKSKIFANLARKFASKNFMKVLSYLQMKFFMLEKGKTMKLLLKSQLVQIKL